MATTGGVCVFAETCRCVVFVSVIKSDCEHNTLFTDVDVGGLAGGLCSCVHQSIWLHEIRYRCVISGRLLLSRVRTFGAIVNNGLPE